MILVFQKSSFHGIPVVAIFSTDMAKLASAHKFFLVFAWNYRWSKLEIYRSTFSGILDTIS